MWFDVLCRGTIRKESILILSIKLASWESLLVRVFRDTEENCVEKSLKLNSLIAIRMSVELVLELPQPKFHIKFVFHFWKVKFCWRMQMQTNLRHLKLLSGRIFIYFIVILVAHKTFPSFFMFCIIYMSLRKSNFHFNIRKTSENSSKSTLYGRV